MTLPNMVYKNGFFRMQVKIIHKLFIDRLLCCVRYYWYFCNNIKYCPMTRTVIYAENNRINRLKVVLAEKNCKGKWLAEQLGKNESTVSRWCSNRMQPSIDMLVKIAELLNVDTRDLIMPKHTK